MKLMCKLMNYKYPKQNLKKEKKKGKKRKKLAQENKACFVFTILQWKRTFFPLFVEIKSGDFWWMGVTQSHEVMSVRPEQLSWTDC